MDNKVTQYSSSPIKSYIQQGLHESVRARFKVIGKSMQPLIQIGDWVLIEPYSDFNQIHIGDIVLIKRSNDFVVHRVIQLNQNYVKTQGDWLRIIDPPNKPDTILGKVVVIEKKRFDITLSYPIINLLNHVVFYLMKLIKIFYRRGQFNGINKRTHQK